MLYHGFREPAPARAAAAERAAAAARVSVSVAAAVDDTTDDASPKVAEEAEETPTRWGHPLEYLPLVNICIGAQLCVGGCSASHGDTKYYWQLCPFAHALQAQSEAEMEGGRVPPRGPNAR